MSKTIGEQDSRIPTRLHEAVEKIKNRDLNINYNGHFPFDKQYFLPEMTFALLWFKEETINALADGQALSSPEVISLGIHNCPYCAAYIKFSFDGHNLTIIGECANPGGFKDVSVELNIPSGKMVFANDLRRWFKIHGSYNINLDVGIVRTIQAYEKVGMAHGFVGNTCPRIYKENETSISISASPLENKWDEDSKKYIDRDDEEVKKETPSGEDVGGICTDLWWYSVVDYNDFRVRFLNTGGTLKAFKEFVKRSCTVVDVTPGVFTVQHFFVHKDETLVGEPLHYAKITWSRQAEKLNLYEKYKNMSRTIGQCYLVAVREYPTLHGFTEDDFSKNLTLAECAQKLLSFPSDRIEHSFYRFLDHTFCTLGGGVEWHRNGWGSGIEIPEETPDFPMPILTQKYSWYPMCRKYCVLYLCSLNKKINGEKISFNESFLAAAYNVIHNILRYGTKARSKTEEKEQIEIARESLKGLASRYPSTVPDYCLDLLDQK